MDLPPQAPEPPILGWREWVALPELGIAAIKAKVDTGARTSSVHACDVVRFVRDGSERVRFRILAGKGSPEVESELVDLRPVRSSGGHVTERPVIRTAIEVASRRWTIELTLASREEMGFRMLLGREAVRGVFLVDPGRSYLAGRRRGRGKRKKAR